jgi:hypothetical protein
LGLEWIITRDGGARATACPSKPTDTVYDLAKKIGLDVNERSKWLRDTKGQPISGLPRPLQSVSVPNTVHITYGNLDNWYDSFDTQRSAAESQMADLEEDFAGDSWTITNDADEIGFGTGYLVKNHTENSGSSSLNQINGFLSDPNIAVWAHVGHGSEVKGKYGALVLEFNANRYSKRTDILKTNHYTANQFKPHHKLAVGIYLTCYAGLQKWKPNVVSKNGKVFATKKPAYVEFSGSHFATWWSELPEQK